MTAPSAPILRSIPWLASAALLWLACTATYFLTAPGRIDMIDGGIRHDVTESLIDLRIPAVRDPLLPGVPGRGDYRYAWYPLGASVTAMPFVLLGNWLGHGALDVKQFAFAMTSVPFAAAVVALMFLIYGRLGCSRAEALNWSLAVAFGTLLWPYAGSSFDAAIQAFWLLLAVWAAIEALTVHSLRWAAVSGGAFAMLINVQEIYVVLVVCVLALFPVTLRALGQRLRDPAVMVIGLGVLAGILLVFGSNVWRFGNPLETGRQISLNQPMLGHPLVGLAGLFLSPAKSIFIYSPTYALGLIGLYRLLRKEPNRFAPIAACFLIQIALISSFRFWAGEWAWGPRYLVASLPLVCVGLPFAWPGRKWRALTWVLCGLGFVVQLLAISVDHQRYYFERSLGPFFWLDESNMYKDSPLLARPSELLAIVKGSDRSGARALVPGPRPFSMTGSLYGPPPDQAERVPQWMREYLVFLVPRPWPLWSRLLPRHQRPGRTDRMATLGAWIALVSFGSLFGLVRVLEPLPSAEAEKAQEKTG